MADQIGQASFGLVVGMSKFNQELDKAGTKAKQAGEEIGDNLTEGAESAIKRGSDGVGKAAAGIATGAGIAFGVALNGAINQEAVTDKVAASLGLDEAQAARAGKVAGQVYADAYGDSFEQVNDAVAAVMGASSELRSASSSDLASMTKDALNYATTFDSDVATAMRDVGVLLDTGIAQSGGHAFDLLIAGATQVPVAMRDQFSDAVEEYSQFGKGLGLTGEEIVGSFASVADGGSYMLDKVADAWKELRIRATDGSDKTKDALTSLGLDWETVGHKISIGGADARQALADITQGLIGVQDPALKSQLAVALFGTQFEDISGDGAKMNEMLATLGGVALPNVAGASERLNETLGSNTKTAVTEVKREFEQWAYGLTDGLLPILQELPDSLQTVIGGILTMGGGALSAGKDIAALAFLMKGTGSTGLVGSLVTAGPYVAAFILALAATAIIVKNWDSIKSWFSDFGQWLKKVGRTMWDGIVDGFKAAINTVISAWNSLSFKVPTVSILGRQIGGQTIGVPKVPPLMAEGGRIRSPGNVIVGDDGPEVLSLGAGAQVTPLDRISSAPVNDHGPAALFVLNVDGKQMARALLPHYIDRQRITGRPAFS
jgi:phage-related minor tail protein